MATWYDLPAEVTQNILEHVVDRLPVRSEPRHAATRATRNAKEKEKDKETALSTTDALNSLLLVSKRFMVYNELEGAILTNATIRIKDLRAWNALEKRYGQAGLAMMQEVVIYTKLSRFDIAHTRTRFPDLHPYLKTKMPNMRRVVIDLTHRTAAYPWILTYDQCINTSKGNTLRQAELSDRGANGHFFSRTLDVTSAARKELQQLLRYPLMFLRVKQDRWATNILNVKDYPRCEVVFEWEVQFAVQSGYDTEPRVSTKTHINVPANYSCRRYNSAARIGASLCRRMVRPSCALNVWTKLGVGMTNTHGSWTVSTLLSMISTTQPECSACAASLFCSCALKRKDWVAVVIIFEHGETA